MSKISWTEVSTLYIADDRYSYEKIARKFRISLSTVKRRAKAENWPYLREEFQKKKRQKLMKLNATHQAEIEERQLRHLRITQDVAHLTIYRVGKKTETGIESQRDMVKAAHATKMMLAAIDAERKILGLRTKPIAFHNPKDIEEYKRMVGYYDPPADELYRNIKDTLATTQELIEHQQRLQSYIDEVDERGRY